VLVVPAVLPFPPPGKGASPFSRYGTECVRENWDPVAHNLNGGCTSAVEVHGGRGAAGTRTSVDTQEHIAASSTAVVDVSPPALRGYWD
jgi:hypothetical protein